MHVHDCDCNVTKNYSNNVSLATMATCKVAKTKIINGDEKVAPTCI